MRAGDEKTHVSPDAPTFGYIETNYARFAQVFLSLQLGSRHWRLPTPNGDRHLPFRLDQHHCYGPYPRLEVLHRDLPHKLDPRQRWLPSPCSHHNHVSIWLASRHCCK